MQEPVSKHKLLLADDSVTIQKVVNLTFADEGIEVVSVGDGNSAMDRLREDAPDIVLADVNMPGLTGYEICAKIKERALADQIPVVLLVGSFEPFDEDEAKRVGADGYLTKPFQSISQLVDKVSELLGIVSDDAVASDHEIEDESTRAYAEPGGHIAGFEKLSAESETELGTSDSGSQTFRPPGTFNENPFADFKDEDEFEMSEAFGDDENTAEGDPSSESTDDKQIEEVSGDFLKTQPLTESDLQEILVDNETSADFGEELKNEPEESTAETGFFPLDNEVEKPSFDEFDQKEQSLDETPSFVELNADEVPSLDEFVVNESVFDESDEIVESGVNFAGSGISELDNEVDDSEHEFTENVNEFPESRNETYDDGNEFSGAPGHFSTSEFSEDKSEVEESSDEMHSFDSLGAAENEVENVSFDEFRADDGDDEEISYVDFGADSDQDEKSHVEEVGEDIENAENVSFGSFGDFDNASDSVEASNADIEEESASFSEFKGTDEGEVTSEFANPEPDSTDFAFSQSDDENTFESLDVADEAELPMPEGASVLNLDEINLLELPPVDSSNGDEEFEEAVSESFVEQPTESYSEEIEEESTDSFEEKSTEPVIFADPAQDDFDEGADIVVKSMLEPEKTEKEILKGSVNDALSKDMVEAITMRVIETLSEKAIREIAWEVVPDLADLIIKKMAEDKMKH